MTGDEEMCCESCNGRSRSRTGQTAEEIRDGCGEREIDRFREKLSKPRALLGLHCRQMTDPPETLGLAQKRRGIDELRECREIHVDRRRNRIIIAENPLSNNLGKRDWTALCAILDS